MLNILYTFIAFIIVMLIVFTFGFIFNLLNYWFKFWKREGSFNLKIIFNDGINITMIVCLIGVLLFVLLEFYCW
jgi:hypothetical protein